MSAPDHDWHICSATVWVEGEGSSPGGAIKCPIVTVFVASFNGEHYQIVDAPPS